MHHCYSDAYIVVKGTITVEGNVNDHKRRNKKLTFKNDAPFRSCISKINNTFIDNAEDLDFVMPMHNLLEYSKIFSITSGSLWNYYKGEINDDANENTNNMINNNKTITSKFIENETKVIRSTPNNNNILDAELAFRKKYLSNFWRSLDLRLIKCKTELDLSWSKECIISAISIIPRVSPNLVANPPVQKVLANSYNQINILNK